LKLSIEKLVMERGGRVVLDHLTNAFRGGEAIVLLGPNGAGKTTLLRALAGLLKPVSGTIALDRPGQGEGFSVGEQCHLIGHTNAVKPSLTVQENCDFWVRFLDSPHPANGESVRAVGGGVERALDRFGLTALADIPARFLSAGQTRRLGLARLLLAPRPVWLLDEPTVSLDAASTKALAIEVDGHVASGGIVIAATHLPLGLATSREVHLGPQIRSRSIDVDARS
jgi:heme exporter protein A